MVLNSALSHPAEIIRTFSNPNTKSFDTSRSVSRIFVLLFKRILLLYKQFEFPMSSYGSNVRSSFELSKDFTPPIESVASSEIVPEDVINPRDFLMAKTELNLILEQRKPLMNT